MFQPPLDLLPSQGLLAEVLLGVANSLNADRRSNESDVVKRLSDLLSFSRSFAFGIDVTLNVAMHLKFASAVLQCHGLVTDSVIPSSPDVVLRAGPPYANDLVPGEVRTGGVLERDAIHRTPSPKQNVVHNVLANTPPLRLLFKTRMRHWD